MSMKKRDHWGIAFAIGVALGVLATGAMAMLWPFLLRGVLHLDHRSPVYTLLLVVRAAFCQAIGIGVFLWLSRMPRIEGIAGETTCRKCGYILRGIREPRCPECGERI